MIYIMYMIYIFIYHIYHVYIIYIKSKKESMKSRFQWLGALLLVFILHSIALHFFNYMNFVLNLSFKFLLFSKFKPFVFSYCFIYIDILLIKIKYQFFPLYILGVHKGIYKFSFGFSISYRFRVHI